MSIKYLLNNNTNPVAHWYKTGNSNMYTTTLNAYLYSGQATRDAKVVLEQGEYMVGESVIDYEKREKLTQVWLPQFDYTYVLRDDSGYLWVPDQWGYPERMSVFFIPNLVKAVANV